jgi:hypothetical protein
MNSEEEVRAAFSCKNCHLSHRKCDRRKPNCGKCHKRGITCFYEKQTRNRPKEIVLDTPTSIQHYLNHMNAILCHTKISLDNLPFILPLMNRRRIFDVVSFYTDFVVTGKESEAEIQKPTNLDFTLALANTALAHLVYGQKTFADNIIIESKKAAIDLTDRCLYDFDGAACSAYFCIYYAYSGNPERTKFYMNQVQLYLHNCPIQNSLCKILDSIHRCCLFTVTKDIDLGEHFVQTAAIVTGHNITHPILNLENIDDCVAKHNQLIDSFELSEYDKRYKKKSLRLMSIGAKLQYLIGLELELAPITLELADLMIAAVEDISVINNTAHFIKRSATVHMCAIKKTGSLKYLPKLEKELCMLKKAAGLSPITMKIQLPFMNELEQVIELYEKQNTV